MKPLLMLPLFLIGISAVQAGVGPGVAGELSFTSPLMAPGIVAPVYSPPVVTAAPKAVYTPGPIYSGPTRPQIVPPLPGESAHAPVVVTVGPIVHPELGARDLFQAPISTPKTLEPTIHPEHGLRGWLHRHHWLR